MKQRATDKFDINNILQLFMDIFKWLGVQQREDTHTHTHTNKHIEITHTHTHKHTHKEMAHTDKHTHSQTVDNRWSYQNIRIKCHQNLI